MKTKTTIEISAPIKNILKGDPQKTLGLFQISSSKKKPQQTTPSLRKNLAIVIDTSGSMGGQPLVDAINGACAFIDRLNPNDQVCVVSYHSVVDVISPPTKCTASNIQLLKSKIQSLSATDSTALHSGWLHGAQQIAPFVGDYDLSRVILISDGDANVGVRDPSVFREEAIRLLHAGIGTSTYGLGHHFNEAIMTSLAQGGQAFYASSSIELEQYFETEFQLMDNVVLKNIRVSIPSGVTLLNDFPVVNNEVILPAVVYGSEAWCLFECENVSPFDISFDVSWEEHDEKHQHNVKLILPEVEVLPKNNNTKKRNLIKERHKEIEASKMQQEAILAAKKGQWDSVNNLLKTMDSLAGNNAYISGVSQTLRGLSQTQNSNLFAKEAQYASTTMSRRISEVNEDTTSHSDSLGLRKTIQGVAVKTDTTDVKNKKNNKGE